MTPILQFSAWVCGPTAVAVFYGLIREAIAAARQPAVQPAKDKTNKDTP